MLHRLLIGATLISGACGIGYEILYLRMLATLFGEMFYVYAALSACFIIAFGAGAWQAHRYEKKLSLFLFASGAYAFIAPAMAKAFSSSPAMAAVHSSGFLTVCVTAAFLVLPALCVGASLPLLSSRIARLAVRLPAFGWVYAMHNIGAGLSVLAVEFALFRWLGMRGSLSALGILNIAAAGLIAWLDRQEQVSSEAVKDMSSRESWPWPLLLAGFASAVFQMIFLKACLHLFQPHREIFALALAVVLLGIPAGAWLVRRLRLDFVNCLLWALIAVGIFYCLHTSLLKDYLWIRRDVLHAPSSLTMFVLNIITACFMGLPAFAFFGGLLPAWVRTNEAVALRSGESLWVCSLGNAAGFLFYVFLGHQYMSACGLLILILGAGWGAAALCEGISFLGKRRLQAAFSVALAAAAFFLWNEQAFYLGRGVSLLPRYKPRIYKQGPDAVIFMKSRYPRQHADFLAYNGFLGIDVSHAGMLNITEIFVGVYPAVYAPSLERAAVIGLGSGMTAGFTSRLFRHTDVLDLNRAFTYLARDIPYANLDLFKNPAARIHITDGRPFLARRHAAYDAIVNTVPSSAYFAAAKLYTTDFYDIVRKALKPGGVFVTWFAAGEYNEEALKIHLATLRSRFPHCALRILKGTYYALICSESPLRPRDWADLKAPRRLEAELKKSLLVYTPEEYIRHGEMSRNLFHRYIPDAPLNTDDLPMLEFRVERIPKMVDQTVHLLTHHAAEMGIHPLAGLYPPGPDPAPLLLRTHIYFHLAHNFYETLFSKAFARNAGFRRDMAVFHAKRVEIARKAGLGFWARRYFLKPRRRFLMPPVQGVIP